MISPGVIDVDTIHPSVIDVDTIDSAIITELIDNKATNNCAPPTIIDGDTSVNTNHISYPRPMHDDTTTAITEDNTADGCSIPIVFISCHIDKDDGDTLVDAIIESLNLIKTKRKMLYCWER